MESSCDNVIHIPAVEAQDIVDALQFFAEHGDGSPEWSWQAQSLAQSLARRLPSRQPADG